MNDHKEIYKEEAYELLAELEASLLELENIPEDEELIAHVFRSMHTIKGSGSMFGFDDVAAFTHEIETVFDFIRDGKIKVTKEIVKLTLDACDHIKKMIDGHEIDEIEEVRIVQAFQKMLVLEEKSDESKTFADLISRQDNIIHDNYYRIRFLPYPNLLKTGNNPLVLLDEVQSLGNCQIISNSKNIPSLKDIDPELCYLQWDIVLNTIESLNDIRDIFIFVEDNCTLEIQPVDDENSSWEDLEKKKIGEILIERGDVNPDDIAKALKEKKRIGEMLLEAKAIDNETLESALKEQKHIREVSKKQQTIASSSSIRVAADKLDSLVNLVGELVTVQARLTRKASLDNDSELISISEEVERLSTELRNNTMNIRMLPVGSTFRRFKRLIHDLSHELNKDIIVLTEGEETELDKTVLEQINDPLMHIIRNAIDHGIETPEIRKAKGKDPQGTIVLSAQHSSSDVLIQISEDGSGLDSDAIHSKAVQKGIISQDETLSLKDIHSLVFAPGFSTAKQVSGVSGRGVGMDVVKRKIESLRGTVAIESSLNKGTKVTLKLPLTLAIADGLLIKVGEGNFILPLLTVEECLELTREEADKAKEQKIINFRGEIISYISLSQLFESSGQKLDIEKVVVINTNGRNVGVGVDKVIGQHQTVIKNLGYFYKDIKNISGASIMGDGTVALILDVNQIVMQLQDGNN